MDGSNGDALTGKQKIRNFNINFGPQHPSAHGVLRLVLELAERAGVVVAMGTSCFLLVIVRELFHG